MGALTINTSEIFNQPNGDAQLRSVVRTKEEAKRHLENKIRQVIETERSHLNTVDVGDVLSRMLKVA